MKANRINLCTAVRNTLYSEGYSSVLACNAVNSALGELKASESLGKLGDGRITKTTYKVTETITSKYEGSNSNVALRFDAWHGLIAKAEGIASFETVAIPSIFRAWLNKFAKADKETVEKEKASVAAQ